jgi:hydroxymethylglutaryl-CoA reductase (NADPH)
MAVHRSRVEEHLRRLKVGRDTEALGEALMPSEDDISPRLVGASRTDPEAVARRWELVPGGEADRAAWLDEGALADMAAFQENIENCIGTVKIPVGLAGPLRVLGLYAHGDYYVPMATTEAALVVSHTRGAQAISEAGGCRCVLLGESVGRAPGFSFADVAEAGRFVMWVTENHDGIKAAAESTTRHGKLQELRFTVEGNSVYLVLEYYTGNAAGQNMVTIATDRACRYIVEHCPIQPRAWYVEANMSGDKKASAQSFQSVRGKKVTAEVVLPRRTVERRLHCDARQLEAYLKMSGVGGLLSGTIGAQGHYANGLAALYLATGQDVACVAESAVGITRFESLDDGRLYAAVTLPNIIVGSVGGGTGLPSARSGFSVLGIDRHADGSANALAEICAALALAGEISIIAALASGQFVQAHEQRTRRAVRGQALFAPLRDRQPPARG